MDFFARQEAARKSTGTLIVLFLIAVILIISAAYVALAAVNVFVLGGGPKGDPGVAASPLAMLWDPSLFGMVATGTAALIGGGSLYKTAALAGGGRTVAELLGGRLVSPDTSNYLERRLLNVVEEMAIAAGTPVPPVYVLDEEAGINAFAAGHQPSDAVVAVTAGTLQQLDRDELQGVLGHEFSHILNGDMRLNLRLMGVLFGIMLIGLTGWILLRSRGGFVVRDDDRRGVNPIPIIGFVLMIVGYVGVFFAKLIQAAVSRQRENLADASAVQFTRNPDGLAGALKKIGASAEGSELVNPRAEEASHLFFGEALGGFGNLFGLLASHPPLSERIRALDPSFDGDFSKVRLDGPGAAETPALRRAKPGGAGQSGAIRPSPLPVNPAQALGRITGMGPLHLIYAAQLLDQLPPPIAAEVRQPLGAQAVIYALLMDRENESVREAQFNELGGRSHPAVLAEVRRILPGILALPAEFRLPTVELAVPTLRQMSEPQFREFFGNVKVLAAADRRTDLFEYALQKYLYGHVASQFARTHARGREETSIATLAPSMATVLTLVARRGHEPEEEIAKAFEAGRTALGWDDPRVQLLAEDEIDLATFDAALSKLAHAAPMLRKQALSACSACIAYDGTVTVEEDELLRTIADSFESPLPALLSGEPDGTPVVRG